MKLPPQERAGTSFFSTDADSTPLGPALRGFLSLVPTPPREHADSCAYPVRTVLAQSKLINALLSVGLGDRFPAAIEVELASDRELVAA